MCVIHPYRTGGRHKFRLLVDYNLILDCLWIMNVVPGCFSHVEPEIGGVKWARSNVSEPRAHCTTHVRRFIHTYRQCLYPEMTQVKWRGPALIPGHRNLKAVSQLSALLCRLMLVSFTCFHLLFCQHSKLQSSVTFKRKQFINTPLQIKNFPKSNFNLIWEEQTLNTDMGFLGWRFGKALLVYTSK